MKHFEFWNPRLFESPYYLYLAYLCLKHGLAPQNLAKANYALDHGEIGIGSKLATQLAFDQTRFLPSALVLDSSSQEQKAAQLEAFAERYSFPVILKPDMGCVGKGITKVKSKEHIRSITSSLSTDYIVQQYTPNNIEFGVFYVRHSGRGRVTGINGKEFPAVIGDSKRSLQELAEAHPRFTAHWDLFLQYLDTSYVPADKEPFQLSFIGSHTMGCKFTNDSHLLTPALEAEICTIADSQPGFNFGRLDVKSPSLEAFQRGDFVVIEVNGVASLPTNMFDPEHSLRQGYRIFFEHARHLVQAAAEQRHQPMALLSGREILRKVQSSQQALNKAHDNSLARA
ncbi:MAG: hypothetical protein AB8B48_17795 [Pseudomonadales bacterium]